MGSLLVAAWLAAVALPEGAAPPALELAHFPDRLHALVWRNWQVTPVERIAATVGATPEEVIAIGHGMGLAGPPRITDDQWRRSYITVIRRNWHLLPYDQLLVLLDWTPEELAFTLAEDDFLFHKLGQLKPRCEPIRYAKPDERAIEMARRIDVELRLTFGAGVVGTTEEPLFHFVEELSAPVAAAPVAAGPTPEAERQQPRYCYSYFALYGDPLLDPTIDPYPDGYLARLREAGVNGVWLQGVLYKLAPFPWDPALSEGYEKRLENLNALVARAKRHGIGVYLYLNEPRTMPLEFFEQHPELKGVAEGERATLCTSAPDVQKYLRESMASICRATPELAGVFTITASENLTSCWSHYQGGGCPRCADRGPATVIAEVNELLAAGIRDADHDARLIAWDWGWQDAWAADAVKKLPAEAALMSVSEWSLPIERGGVANTVGEYSISAIGPGPRATRQWATARERGLAAFAKVQAGTTWELGSVPYLPAAFNVAKHGERLRGAGVDGVMLGWTLGGFPSPNLEAFGLAASGQPAEDALRSVVVRRFGKEHVDDAMLGWRICSDALGEYPYDGAVVYNAPHHAGPANLLWPEPTGYRATMVGIPYDDVTGWRGPYPADVLANQFERTAAGFEQGASYFYTAAEQAEMEDEARVATAASIHFYSAAMQTRFVLARDRLLGAKTAEEAAAAINEIEILLAVEMRLAKELYQLQSRDSRLGFEATNQYFFVPMDLAEKVLNCRRLLEQWLPAQRARFEAPKQWPKDFEAPPTQVRPYSEVLWKLGETPYFYPSLRRPGDGGR